MIAVDTNILVYAHRADSPWHEAAYEALRRLAEGAAPWAIPWPCIHEFLAIVTSPRVYRPATPLERAADQVEAWMESPSLHLLGEGAGYWEVLRDQLAAGHITGGAVHDARVASLCRLHGVSVLWSADRDFSRFGGLVANNPLAG